MEKRMRDRGMWLKYSVLLLTDMWTDSRKRPRSSDTEEGLKK